MVQKGARQQASMQLLICRLGDAVPVPTQLLEKANWTALKGNLHSLTDNSPAVPDRQDPEPLSRGSGHRSGTRQGFMTSVCMQFRQAP